MKNFILLLVILSICNKLYSQCVTKISSGENHAIGLKANGTIHTWGNGTLNWGQLGFGNSLDVLTPTQVGNSLDGNLIFGGSYNTFVIKTNGTLWGTGRNEQGQLGIGTLTNSPTFIQLGSETNWKYISADRGHTLGVKTNGTLWAWGSNYQGKLGDGTFTDRLTPIQIGTSNNWTKVATGIHQSFGLKMNGTIWGWGLGSGGALGINFTTGNVITPTQIGTDTDWVDISSHLSSVHTLALKNNGKIYVWGQCWSSGTGALGLGAINVANIPTQINNDSDWQFINVAFNTSFAIKTNGTLWGWGQNDHGQLGDGTTVDRNIPTQIGTDTDWVVVSAGRVHTIALKSNGALYAWGDNTYGQLGNGNYTSMSIPTLIVPACILSNNEFAKNYALIYPNPAQDEVSIFVDNHLQPDYIEVYDMTGRMVLKNKIEVSGDSFSFNITKLTNGVYNVILKNTGEIVSVSKLIKN